MIHVAFAGGHVDALRRPPEQLLDAWPMIREVARAAHGDDVRVTVVQGAVTDAMIEHGGLQLRFVRVPAVRPGAWQGARRIARAVRDLRPDIIHLRGVRFPLHVHALRRACPGVPILAQYHADRVPSRLRLRLERRLLRGLDGVICTTAEQVQPLLAAGLLPRGIGIIEAAGGTSRFLPGDRAAARLASGTFGEPCVVWVGRLAAVKDPLTALAAFSAALPALPDARLWCAFGAAPMREQVEAYIDAHPELHHRVRLLGELPAPAVEQLLRGADIFLASSLSESTGFALAEALACGVAPVVTDVPAFRRLTGNGSIGALFPVGDAAAGAQALVRVAADPPPRERVRLHFDAHVSPDALGGTLRQAYRQYARRRRTRVCLIVPGGVDASGTHRVIPCILALIERIAAEVELDVLALRQLQHTDEYELCGARVHCVPAHSRTAGLRWLLQGRHDRFDVLHAVWMHPQGTTAACARAALRRPVLLHVNGGDLADVPTVGFGGRASLPGRARLRLAVRAANRITVPSEVLARRARQLGFEAERLTFGVPLDRWPAAPARPRSPAQPMRLLSVGTLNRVKDHATLLHAVALLRQRGIHVTVTCVGEDVMDGAAARLATRLGIDDAIAFAGFVPHAELRAHFDAADALVVSSRYEGDPVAALEAAVAGVPVVGTAVGHLVDWAPEAALTCAVGDAARLADVIAAIAQDDTLRRSLAVAAQAIALAHDADRAAERVLSLYQGMVRSG